MERSVAIKKLGKLLGKSLGYRISDRAPTREQREAAGVELKAACAERNKVREQKDARFRAILAADVEYQNLLAASKAASERVDRLSSMTQHHKITVGTSNGMFFTVKAEGDSWEDVIDKLTEKEDAS